jgi:hypothetical protein
MKLIAQAELKQEITGHLHATGRAGIANFEAHSHIIECGEGVKESERLENKADFLLANCGLLWFSQLVYRNSVHEHCSFIR